MEGPEAGVYYRGEGDIKGGEIEISLPEYVQLIAKDFTVHITPIGRTEKVFSASRVREGKFKVYGCGEFFWIVYGKRLEIEVEPYKEEKTLRGFGPYTWI